MHNAVEEGITSLCVCTLLWQRAVLFCVHTHCSGRGKYYFVCMHFNAKVGRENIFKPTIRQESHHQDSNDNGVRIVNFTTPKNLVVKSMMFPHQNIHKYTWTSPDGKTRNHIDHVLIDKRWHLSVLDV